jgi:hypothetical protein
MTTPAPELDADMLAELAEMDLSAARHVHTQLLAATEPDTVVSLGRAYQRAARSLRQTLALKARMARDAAQAERAASPREPMSDRRETAIIDRECDIQDAVERILYAEIPDDEDYREVLSERFVDELNDWTEEDDFTEVDLDAQVLRACRYLNIPEHRAVGWRDLPHPTTEAVAEMLARYRSDPSGSPGLSADSG